MSTVRRPPPAESRDRIATPDEIDMKKSAEPDEIKGLVENINKMTIIAETEINKTIHHSELSQGISGLLTGEISQRHIAQCAIVLHPKSLVGFADRHINRFRLAAVGCCCSACIALPRSVGRYVTCLGVWFDIAPATTAPTFSASGRHTTALN